jgi:hypothetical protein
MGHRQCPCADHHVAIEKNVDVDRPRSISEAVFPAQLTFEPLRKTQKLEGPQLGGGAHDRVQEKRLVFEPGGLGLVD